MDTVERLSAYCNQGRIPGSMLHDACEHLGHPETMDLISPVSSGWMVAGQVDRFGSCEVHSFAEWWLVERIVERVQECVARACLCARARFCLCHGCDVAREMPTMQPWATLQVRSAHRARLCVVPHRFMRTAFPACELIERHDQRLRYRLPDAGTLSVADMFALFESEKEALHIEE